MLLQDRRPVGRPGQLCVQVTWIITSYMSTTDVVTRNIDAVCYLSVLVTRNVSHVRGDVCSSEQVNSPMEEFRGSDLGEVTSRPPLSSESEPE